MPFPRTRTEPVLWSPDLAYVVGLITTDGNLSSDGRHITLRSNDRPLLDTCRKILQKPTVTIAETHSSGFTTNTCHRVQIGDIALYEWLRAIGLTPNKSKTIGPLSIPDEYFRDFLRGHLDGDGSVYTYRDDYPAKRLGNVKYVYTRLYLRFLSASELHIRWINDTIIRLTDLHGRMYRRAPRVLGRSPQWEVRYAKRETLALLAWMYYKPNLPALERKRRIIYNFLSCASQNVDTRRERWYSTTLKRLCQTFHVPAYEQTNTRP